MSVPGRPAESNAGPDASGEARRPTVVSDLDNLVAGIASVATLRLLGVVFWADAQLRAAAALLCLAGLIAAVCWLLFRLSAAWLRRS